jgi:two-component system chemotaxis sensor kinase CheA
MLTDNALFSEYLSEAEELLDTLLTNLDLLTPKPNINLINRIFRAIHSLKGLLGMMEQPELQALAHDFEDILDDIRLGQLKPDDEAIVALRESGAGLATLVAGVSRGVTNPEAEVERLRELLVGIVAHPREHARQQETALEALGLSERERKLLTEYERHRITENFDAESAFYEICVEFKVSDIDSKYRNLTERLGETGELITTLPDNAKAQDAVAFKLIFATQLKEPEVKKITDKSGGRISRLGRSSWRIAGEALKVVTRKKAKAETSKSPTDRALPANFTQETLQPLSPNVRVELNRIDELSVMTHELSVETKKLSTMANHYLQAAGLGAQARFDLNLHARRLEREFLELEERLVELRMISLAQTFTRAARLAGRIARELGKSISVDIVGRETLLDKMIVDRVADPIYHILRNAIDHGMETPQERRLKGKSARGAIKLEARLEGSRTVIAIADDGRGIDKEAVRRRAIEIGAISEEEELAEEELLRLIFHSGFSTAEQVSPVSGRGVGLNAAERVVYELGGEIRIFSELGQGATFEIVVPTTLVMIPAFIVKVSQWFYAINVGQITELIYITAPEIRGRDGRRTIRWRGQTIPLVELCYLLGLGGARLLHQQVGERNGNGVKATERVPVLVTRAADKYVAIAVEQFEGQREIIVKSLGGLGRKVKGVSGAVDLEGGDVALVLDLQNLLMLRSTRL